MLTVYKPFVCVSAVCSAIIIERHEATDLRTSSPATAKQGSFSGCWMPIEGRDVYLVIVLVPSPLAEAFDDSKRFTATPSRQQTSKRSEIGEIV